MPLCQTGGYRVRPSAVNKVKPAIKEFVEYVRANEPDSAFIPPSDNHSNSFSSQVGNPSVTGLGKGCP
jgi:hypothetical protein